MSVCDGQLDTISDFQSHRRCSHLNKMHGLGQKHPTRLEGRARRGPLRGDDRLGSQRHNNYNYNYTTTTTTTQITNNHRNLLRTVNFSFYPHARPMLTARYGALVPLPLPSSTRVSHQHSHTWRWLRSAHRIS